MMKDNSMLRIVVYPEGKLPEIRFIENSREAFKEVAEGPIETFNFSQKLKDEGITFICNNESKFNDMIANRAMFNDIGECCDVLYGPFFAVGFKAEHFVSLEPEEVLVCFERYYTPGEIQYYGGKPILVPMDNMMPDIDDVISELEIIRDSGETNMVDVKAAMLI